MPTIDGTPPTNPAEAPGTSLQQAPRITVIIHDFAQEPTAPRLALPPDTQPATRKGRRRGRHELHDRTWLDLLERVLCSWPITLRVVVLLVVLLTGTAAAAMTLGVGGQLLFAALGLYARRTSQRRRPRTRA
jgi:hypothetical protein